MRMSISLSDAESINEFLVPVILRGVNLRYPQPSNQLQIHTFIGFFKCHNKKTCPLPSHSCILREQNFYQEILNNHLWSVQISPVNQVEKKNN